MSGKFFAVDRESWGAACALGLNPACAYLVMAAGTGGDNRRTAWSVHAIEKYAGIGRKRAHDAVVGLIEARLVRKVKDTGRPAYVIGLDGAERNKGDALIWLPNALVTGLTVGTDSPLAQIRQTQNQNALRLLIEFYGAHRLLDDSGIDRRALRQEYTAMHLYERGQHVVWAFTAGVRRAWPDKLPAQAFMTGRIETVDGQKRDAGWPVFWEALSLLAAIKLLEFVPYLFESGDNGETLHAVGWWSGEEAERTAAVAASRAGAVLLDAASRKKIPSNALLIPAPRHLGEVQVVGIARLKFRPRTSMTAAWFSGMEEQNRRAAARYMEILSQYSPAAEVN
ncbi:hypothetical protein [Acidocella sp. KAb 2-4]|uniref:hypothetical protein n=1 Tax=Acidocella sp. KAb 2-4 TaxID=2885158 RepID=UPI001D096412|nr:hypothetical protein [Acidocella sp. KAb 2-4]MCB5944252.1 hypothetical protein [Acidocella sp. KAb 2-4]